MSIEATEQESAAVAKAPTERVTLASMEAKIVERHDFVAADVLGGEPDHGNPTRKPPHPSLALLSVCILVMQNGFVLIGKSAPASAKNFNRELGRKFAYEDAIKQLWPLEGYALRERLAGE